MNYRLVALAVVTSLLLMVIGCAISLQPKNANVEAVVPTVASDSQEDLTNMQEKDCVSTVSNPQDRVTSFIADWYEQWAAMRADVDFEKAKSTGTGSQVDFDQWRKRVRSAEKCHFVPMASSNTANGFGSDAHHNPETEIINSSEIDGEKGSVVTLKTGMAGLSEYRVYDLVSDQEAGWLIANVLILYDPPQNPLLSEVEKEAIFANSLMDAPLVPLEDDLKPDENLLFTDGRTVSIDDSTSDTTRVERVGYLHIHSGIIGIRDYGYDAYGFEPLERRIPPGKYLVETVSVFKRIAAIRIILNEGKQAVSWRTAKPATGRASFGVDAGNLAIFDAESYAQVSHLQKERIYNSWIYDGTPRLFSMTHENDGVIASSGYGDGVYPAYWGIDESGEIVSLVIDFWVLVNENSNGVLTTR